MYQLQPKSNVVNVITPEKKQISKYIIFSYKLEWCTICMLRISMLAVARFFILEANKVRICKGYLHSNASHMILFVSDIYRYVPIWIGNISGYISLFKFIGAFKNWFHNTQKEIYPG